MTHPPVAAAVTAVLESRRRLSEAVGATTKASREVSEHQAALGDALAAERLFQLGNYVLVPAKECSKEQLDQAAQLACGGP